MALQAAAEELLAEIARGAVRLDEHVISRLDKLASDGARLAYGQGCLELESQEMHNLVAWCDHLDEPAWKAEFIAALRSSPLRSPW